MAWSRAGSGSRAGSRARASSGSRAWAWAGAGSGSRAWEGAWAGSGAFPDSLEMLMMYDMAEEGGEIVWDDVREGGAALIEMHGRWYCGHVIRRTQVTARLFPVVCIHDTGDFGMFLTGRLSTSSEVTPMPRPIEVNLATAEMAMAYDPDHFAAINRRTHQEEGAANG